MNQNTAITLQVNSENQHTAITLQVNSVNQNSFKKIVWYRHKCGYEPLVHNESKHGYNFTS